MRKEVREAIDAADQRRADPNAPKVDRRIYLGSTALAEQRINDKISAVKVAGQKVKVRAERAASAVTTKRLQKFTERLEARHTRDRLALKRSIKNDLKRSVENSLGREVMALREAHIALLETLKQVGVLADKAEESQ